MLDEKLGALLRSIFYADSSYEAALEKWVRGYERVSDAAHEHLSGKFEVETLFGERHVVNGKDIIVELSRSPRVTYAVAPSYFSSFAYVEEILERLMDEPEATVRVDRDLVRRGIKTARRAEEGCQLYALAYPSTFSFDPYPGRYPNEIEVPPLVPPPLPHREALASGIYVTITGIPGLERLYADARRMGITLYSNDIAAVAGAIQASPRVIPNERILFQFARSGWSSVWTSMLSGTPIVVPDFDSEDDPEIYFNNKTIEALKIGFVWRGESLEDIVNAIAELKEPCGRIRKRIEEKWGTVDGNRYSAKLFVDDFIKKFV
mgnify:CR=1 FL=1